MPLRLLEVTVPGEALDRVPELLEEAGVVDFWTATSGEAAGVVRVLLDARYTEGVSDLFVRHFGSREDFRLVLIPVEATVPTIAEPAPEEPVEGGNAESGTTGPQRISREELYEDIAEASQLTAVYVVMVALSTVVAAVGLVRGDVAIIIGAMVIAPLLGPNVALALASTLGDLELAKRSLKAIAAGVSTAAAISLFLGVVLTVDPTNAQIVSRTQPGVGDILLALAAGAAGSLAFTSGVPAVVVGVMVAVALLPPLVVAGLLVGTGEGSSAAGAFVLLLVNVTCINLAAVTTFFLQKVRPRTWWEADRARKATRLAAAIWVMMLLVLLGLILFARLGVA